MYAKCFLFCFVDAGLQTSLPSRTRNEGNGSWSSSFLAGVGQLLCVLFHIIGSKRNTRIGRSECTACQIQIQIGACAVRPSVRFAQQQSRRQRRPVKSRIRLVACFRFPLFFPAAMTVTATAPILLSARLPVTGFAALNHGQTRKNEKAKSWAHWKDKAQGELRCVALRCVASAMAMAFEKSTEGSHVDCATKDASLNHHLISLHLF